MNRIALSAKLLSFSFKTSSLKANCSLLVRRWLSEVLQFKSDFSFNEGSVIKVSNYQIKNTNIALSVVNTEKWLNRNNYFNAQPIWSVIINSSLPTIHYSTNKNFNYHQLNKPPQLVISETSSKIVFTDIPDNHNIRLSTHPTLSVTGGKFLVLTFTHVTINLTSGKPPSTIFKSLRDTPFLLLDNSPYAVLPYTIITQITIGNNAESTIAIQNSLLNFNLELANMR